MRTVTTLFMDGQLSFSSFKTAKPSGDIPQRAMARLMELLEERRARDHGGNGRHRRWSRRGWQRMGFGLHGCVDGFNHGEVYC